MSSIQDFGSLDQQFRLLEKTESPERPFSPPITPDDGVFGIELDAEGPMPLPTPSPVEKENQSGSSGNNKVGRESTSAARQCATKPLVFPDRFV